MDHSCSCEPIDMWTHTNFKNQLFIYIGMINDALMTLMGGKNWGN